MALGGKVIFGKEYMAPIKIYKIYIFLNYDKKKLFFNKCNDKCK